MAKNQARNIVSNVAALFEMEKVSWAVNIKMCNQCLADGFTEEDILKAATNMRRLDKQYWSTYSLFNKIDYWLNQTSPVDDKPKGVW